MIFALTIWIAALLYVSCSAGREVCEVKMLDKLKDKKLSEGVILPEQLDDVELPAEEKSTMWKKAVILYSVSTPLVLSVGTMFLIDSASMFKG